MADGQVIFEIKGDNKPIKESLNETTSAIKTAGQEWDKAAGESGGSISSALTGAFETVVKSAAFYKIGKMLVDLGVESVNLASDLQEVQNVVDVTFGAEGSKKIEKSLGLADGFTVDALLLTGASGIFLFSETEWVFLFSFFS